MRQNVRQTLSLVLLWLAAGCALVVVALDFEHYHVDGDPNLAGWIGAALLAYFGSLLAEG